MQASGGRTLQRIGLSATQRPLEEVARFLGGAESSESAGQLSRQVGRHFEHEATFTDLPMSERRE